MTRSEISWKRSRRRTLDSELDSGAWWINSKIQNDDFPQERRDKKVIPWQLCDITPYNIGQSSSHARMAIQSLSLLALASISSLRGWRQFGLIGVCHCWNQANFLRSSTDETWEQVAGYRAKSLFYLAKPQTVRLTPCSWLPMQSVWLPAFAMRIVDGGRLDLSGLERRNAPGL